MGKRAMIASAGAAVALAAGAGGSYAAGGLGGGSGPGDTGSEGIAFEVKLGGPADQAAVAAYLGLTKEQLRTQLESGKTLAQIATDQGKSVSGLEDIIYAQAKTNLDQAVADGKVTAAQEQTMLADLKSHLDDIVNHTGPRGGVRIVATAIAGYLGLSEAELRSQAESGKSLAQIASAQGKSLEGLKAAILAEAKSRLDEAVAAGKISAAAAKAMLDELTSHVDDLVNRTGPPHRAP
jgi:hypothetical protein